MLSLQQMKVLIVKGWMGFGDRLESLKMCVDYALRHNRAIYVDWRDSIWSHGSESFYKYFRLSGVPQIEVYHHESTVYPPWWQGKLDTQLTTDIANTYKNELESGVYENKEHEEEIVVHSCIAQRRIFYPAPFFKLHVIDPRILEKVRLRQSMYKLSNRVGIHLRGTDRASSLQYKETRIRQLSVRLVTMGILNGMQCIVVSDDPEYIRLWKSRFRDIPVLTEIGNLGGRAGVHNMTEIPISKYDLNVDMLVDFFTLASCRQVISTSPDSRFTHEAIRLHPVIQQILS